MTPSLHFRNKPYFFIIYGLRKTLITRGFFTIVFAFLFFNNNLFSQQADAADVAMEVGVARIDITPESPIRLAGYANREKSESEITIHRLWAKALVFGSDAQHPAVFITVDLIGIPAWITARLTESLSKKTGISSAQLVICSSHTHGGPELGNLLNILQYKKDQSFSDSLLGLDQLLHITAYTELLSQKLEELVLAALKDRKPAYVAWGQGQAGFAKNRRPKGGPVDPSLPFLRVVNTDGKLKAILANYACHGTTLDADVNKIHGDWVGEAQRLIEENHPGVVAMVSIGCGGDANPRLRGKSEYMKQYGQEISDNVNKLLQSQLQPISVPPVTRIKWIRLPYTVRPSLKEFTKQSEDKSVKGYYARLALERLARGETIPEYLSYPVQVWTFGNALAMINLGGEVVADYSVRLKNELGAENIWINAYANDVSCYIASRRLIREGGYETEESMYFYNKPSPFIEDIEDSIVNAVHQLLPATFKEKRDTINSLELIQASPNSSVYLTASKAESTGPTIKYMPEWKAFGWFNTPDTARWDLQVSKKASYEVYLEWSVSDKESGKTFLFESGSKKIKGVIGKTGSWFTYRKEKIGTIQLTAGLHKLVFRSAPSSKRGVMFDLRQIILIPSN
ncbi:neutral/alkaline non-lysosomal ceramidase N-terminal domain-containing protein [Flavitalea sp.]|nr:neutral/alkaline non-lysosomal ceramidase N-terminal domain-containing protein [Flavitalea sp.]